MNINNLATTLLGFAVVNLAGADCSWGGPTPEMKCGPVGENSTYTFYIQVDDTRPGLPENNIVADAFLAINWGVSNNSYITYEPMNAGKLYKFQSTFAYNKTGYYVVGHEIALLNIFGYLAANGTSSCCTGELSEWLNGLEDIPNYFSSSGLLRVDQYSCEYGVTTNTPTIPPYPSETPTDYPITISSATSITTLPIVTILTFLSLLKIMKID